MAKFVGSLSGIALSLAAVGLYGVLAYATRQRTTGIGLGLALGATPTSILTMIVRRGLGLVVMGAAFGLAGAIVAVRFVALYASALSRPIPQRGLMSRRCST